MTLLLSYLTVETFLKEKRGGGEETDCESVNVSAMTCTEKHNSDGRFCLVKVGLH